MHPIYLQQIQTVYWIGLNIGIGYLRENFDHREIRQILLGSAGVVRCPGLSNRCTFGLANQQAGKYIPATELELIRFLPLPLGELVWNLSTQVNDIDLAAYINAFDPMRDNRRRFTPFLVYNMVYPSIYSNLVNLATLINWYDSFCTHTFSNLLRKTLLRSF